MRNKKGQFIAGTLAENILPIGAVRIRTRHKRSGEKRAFIKVAEPNTWVLLARHTWESINGPIQKGMGIHHKDGNKLNDNIENLELVSKAKHLEIHRPEFLGKIIKHLIELRKKKRWSTKSSTKRVGRHPKNCTCPIHFQSE